MMSANSTFQEIHQAFQDHHSFALVSHMRPDGDAIGSILALGHSLEEMGKTVRYLNVDGCPESLAFLAGSGKVEVSAAALAAGSTRTEVAIFLDTAAKARVGEASLEATKDASVLINIDHHVSNPGYGDLNYIDSTSPATGQILYDLITALEMPLPAATRDAIYVATSTDTGSFRFPATTARTYEMAADLVNRGLEVGPINQATYDEQPMRRIQLLRALLNTLEFESGDRIAHWCLREETKEEYALVDDDTEGMIDHIRSIAGVVVAVFFEELAGGKIRVSVRSQDPEVSAQEICAVFGGGGHHLAAGIRMAGPLAEARDRVLAEIQRRLS